MDPPPTKPPAAQPYSPEQAMYPPAHLPGQYPVVTQQPAPCVQQTSNTTVVVNQQPVDGSKGTTELELWTVWLL